MLPHCQSVQFHYLSKVHERVVLWYIHLILGKGTTKIHFESSGSVPNKTAKSGNWNHLSFAVVVILWEQKQPWFHDTGWMRFIICLTNDTTIYPDIHRQKWKTVFGLMCISVARAPFDPCPCDEKQPHRDTLRHISTGFTIFFVNNIFTRLF